ncbi:MAG: tRNA (adenosine(37)-N6)-threonylcarbamoyltransferase complex ATPase subunit type 1 TsaE [Desulfuromonadales bacterium]|nr:tRNA (adenosine(37)-N6)-threonylcarbamoyltransferase complex ATPase subunit type 1 TsaE [Desulfuromonadales bacterium]
MISARPEDTRALGQLLGGLAGAGLVVLLNGDLGAGKTCFAQGVASGLGVSPASPVTSPSYTLLNIHHGRLPLYHFDLYRLSQVDDLAELGYDEFAEGDGLTLVEWADRMTAALSASVSIFIEYLAEQQRRLRFDALDDRGETLLQQLAVRSR